MKVQSTISILVLNTILYICFSSIKDVNAFTASGAGTTISRSPVSEKAEWQQGVEIELPNLVLLFDRITQASPLAKQVIERGNTYKSEGDVGFDYVDDEHPELRWKRVEANSRKTVHRIDKADNFQGVKTPLLRFRSTIKGPCIGERFSHILTHIDERKKWDDQVAKNYEIYPIDPGNDYCALDNAVLCDEERYGQCKKIGVGYTETKQGIIAPREQLILGGMQEYDNGATILWGTEMEESSNHLLPEGPRHVRAHSYMFAASKFHYSYLQCTILCHSLLINFFFSIFTS